MCHAQQGTQRIEVDGRALLISCHCKLIYSMAPPLSPAGPHSRSLLMFSVSVMWTRRRRRPSQGAHTIVGATRCIVPCLKRATGVSCCVRRLIVVAPFYFLFHLYSLSLLSSRGSLIPGLYAFHFWPHHGIPRRWREQPRSPVVSAIFFNNIFFFSYLSIPEC